MNLSISLPDWLAALVVLLIFILLLARAGSRSQ